MDLFNTFVYGILCPGRNGFDAESPSITGGRHILNVGYKLLRIKSVDVFYNILINK